MNRNCRHRQNSRHRRDAGRKGVYISDLFRFLDSYQNIMRMNIKKMPKFKCFYSKLNILGLVNSGITYYMRIY
jgi:hypothetical protein